MSDLIVYYSLSGKSKRVAGWLATSLGADIAEIVETRPRGFEGRAMFRCLFDSFLRRRPAIAPMAKQASAYDRVILTCPVWAARIAGPARTWLYEHGGNAKYLGLALASGSGRAYPQALSEFETAIGRAPDAMLTISEADHGKATAEAKVVQFANGIRPQAAKFEKN